MSEETQWPPGLPPDNKRMNVRNQLRRLRDEPLYPFLERLRSTREPTFWEDEIERYQMAYWFYYLSLERLLPEMSLAVRWRNGPYWAIREHRKYTDSERKLAARYNAIARYLEYDFVNCIIHTRILLDRVASLSRTFLAGGKLPSFTSFAKHRKFFLKSTHRYGDHEEYAAHIRSRTNWFGVLKNVRDKFIVHLGPKHRKFWGIPYGRREVDLTLFLDSDQNPPPRHTLTMSIHSLVREVDGFLRWFTAYGMRSLDRAKSVSMASVAHLKS